LWDNFKFDIILIDFICVNGLIYSVFSLFIGLEINNMNIFQKFPWMIDFKQ